MKFRLQIGSNRPLANRNARRRLLPEEVVDAEDLALTEGLVHHGVEPDRAVQIAAERLLHDDSGPIDQARLPQRLDDREGCPRRDAEVVEATGTLPQLLLGSRDRRRQGFWPIGLPYVLQLVEIVLDLIVGHLPGAKLSDGAAGKLAKRTVVEIVE